MGGVEYRAPEQLFSVLGTDIANNAVGDLTQTYWVWQEQIENFKGLSNYRP